MWTTGPPAHPPAIFLSEFCKTEGAAKGFGAAMSGVGEGAGATAKVLEVLRDLPLWLLTGLAATADLLLVVRVLSGTLPAGVRPWLIVAAVLLNVLVLVRSIAVLIDRIPAWRAAGDARRRFHLTPNSRQSHWSTSKQSDDSVITQVSVRLLVKNRTQVPLALTSGRIISPRVRGELVHSEVSVRAVDGNTYGSAAESGHLVPPGVSLPARVLILIRGVPRRKPDKEIRVRIGVTDDEGNEQRVKVNMRVLTPAVVVPAGASLEVVSAIRNPIEREVAAVLQAELARYDKHGRRFGG